MAVAAPLPVTPPAAQSIQIDIRGAIAMVTVTRTLPGAEVAGTAQEDVLDIALPAGAALMEVDVDATGRFETPAPVARSRARDGYGEAVRALGLHAREVPFEDEATTRIRIASKQQKAGAVRTVRYRFSSLLRVTGERAELSFPPSPELSAPPSRVSVRADVGQAIANISIGGVAHPIARGATATATEPGIGTGHRWVVSLGLDRAPSSSAQVNGTSAAPPPHLTALGARASLPSGGIRVAYALGLAPSALQPLPERVLFVVDRSRSVGPGGLEAERDIARRILLALPPSTQFDALFFDRGQTRLFPALRAATRQALAALEDEMVPAQLQNGTDLRGALTAAGELLRRDGPAYSPRALVVVLTDGAVGSLGAAEPPGPATNPAAGRPTTTSRSASASAPPDPLGAHPGVDVMMAVFSVRPNDDPAVSPDERRALGRIAQSARLGGVERALHTGEIADVIPAALEALHGGGDVFAVRLGTRDTAATVATTLGPGEAAGAVVSLPGKSRQLVPASLTVMTGAETRAVPFKPVSVENRWLSSWPANADTRLLLGPALAVLVEPVLRPPSEQDAPGPSGYLERSVVRDALSLAFTPRARACYMTRTGATPADRDLTGRVRLAIELVRGEVGNARIESTTLARPNIERCLQEAAFALDVPRAYRNDERVTAILNLVFRPRTPERALPARDPGISRDLDLLIESALKDAPARDAGADTTTAPD